MEITNVASFKKNAPRPEIVSILRDLAGSVASGDLKPTESSFPYSVLDITGEDLTRPDEAAVRDFLRAQKISDAVIRRAFQRRKVVATLGRYPENIRELVAIYVVRYEVEMELSGSFRRRKGRKAWVEGEWLDMDDPEDPWMMTLAPTITSEREIVDDLKMINDIHRLGFSERGIERAWAEWTASRRRWLLSELRDRLAHDKRADHAPDAAEWQRWAKAVADPAQNRVGEDEEAEARGLDVVIAVMQHFIWQVKRKLLGLPVSDHMMPVLIGATGGGKSVAVETLLRPIGQCYDNFDFARLQDERHSEALLTVPVLFMDEMAYASTADVNTLKSKITLQVVAYKPLFGNALKRGPMMSTFIGTANFELASLIRDNTSLRRFFPVHCRYRLDWDAVNEVDYVRLWRSVDPHADSPIKPVKKWTTLVQEAERNRSSVELWLDQRATFLGRGMGKLAPDEWHPALTLFDLFAEFDQKTSGRNATGLIKWGSEMHRLSRLPGSFIQRRRTSAGVEYRLNLHSV